MVNVSHTCRKEIEKLFSRRPAIRLPDCLRFEGPHRKIGELIGRRPWLRLEESKKFKTFQKFLNTFVFSAAMP